MANRREKLLNDKLDYLYSTKRIFREVLEEQGVEVSDEDTFRDYADKIKNMGVGDVLLFESVEEMNAFENPKENVLALVYKSDDNTSSTIRTRYTVMPKEVVLDFEEIPVNDMYGRIYIINDTTGNMIARGDITATGFELVFYDEELTIEYTSTDGKTFIRQTDIENPFDFGDTVYIEFDYYEYEYRSILSKFFKTETGTFIGLYKCIDGVFMPVGNHLSLSKTNQILTGYTAYGASGLITGDGSYITNIKTSEYVKKYLPSINNNTYTASAIQDGTRVRPMEFVQREQIKSDDAFTQEYDSSDCVVQLADTRDVVVDVPSQYRTLVQNYINAQEKYNYAFFIGDIAYRLYIGYNYNTTQVKDAEEEWHTEPHQMTAFYGFIVNLEDLSIYKTFQNNQSWEFTSQGHGGLLTYAYSVKSDCIVIICDMAGWGSSGGAFLSLTTIQAGTGTRSTKYFTMDYSVDYTYKYIAHSSYDQVQDCYYLEYRSFVNKPVAHSSSKRIVKLTPSGSYSSIFTSSEDMQNISYLWTDYFKNIDSLIYYVTDSKGAVLRNLATNKEIPLYGNTYIGTNYWGLKDNNIYVSTKETEDSDVYNIFAIDKTTLEMTKVPNTESSSRLSSCFYTYNRELCVYKDNKIISLEGEVVAKFIKSMLNNPSISGIDRINDYMYRASFADYNLVLASDTITAKLPTYTYFRYADITEFPVKYDLCMVASGITSSYVNDDTTLYKYQSLVLTDVARSNEELYAEIERLNDELEEAKRWANTILG